jgi:hypothetical protein
MKKIVKLTENQLIRQIRNSISKNLNESDYSTDIERGTQPREYDVKSIFGDKYSRYIPNDVIRYMRKNPYQIIKRLYDIYGEDVYMYLDRAKGKPSSDEGVEMMDDEMMTEAFEEEDDNFDYGDDEGEESDSFMERLKSVVEGNEDLEDYDIEEIFSYTGPKRSFRGSIYVDGIVPETEDKEFDRKVAIKIMEYFAKKTEANQYVGGVGFKRRDITKPYDTDF